MKPFDVTEAIETQQQVIINWQNRAKKAEPGAAAEVLAAIEGLKALQALLVPQPPQHNPQPFSNPGGYQTR